MHQSQPNGHATIIGLNTHNNNGMCQDNVNNIKIPPRPPIRSTTTMTTTTSQSSPAEKQSCLSSIGSGGNGNIIGSGGSASSTGNNGGIINIGINSIANESPNIKFNLTTAAQQKQHQVLPQAAMNEMRVW